MKTQRDDATGTQKAQDERTGKATPARTLAEMREQCKEAKGVCVVGCVLLVALLVGSCQAAAAGDKTLLTCVNECCSYVLWLATCLVGVRFFAQASKEGGPFRQERVRDIKLISRLVILSSCLPGMVCWIAGKVLEADGSVALAAEAVEFGHIIELPLLFAGFIIWAFALIIGYGCVLQQKDDGLV